VANHLRNELEKLKTNLLSLSSEVERALNRAVLSVRNGDVNLAKEVLDADNIIDQREVEVEEQCLAILALHQPVAKDLRFVIAVLKINNDLERIGDLAVNIAERAIYLKRQPPISIPFDFVNMSQKAVNMLKRALDAFINMDLKTAHAVWESDDEIDEINRQVYDKVYSGVRENPEQVEALIHYLSISRHLERIGDYATNICEDVIYMAEGKIVRHSPEGA
jgi:phosphate transport system protein